MTKRKPKKRGPKPERLKLHGNWEDNVATFLKKKKPPEGWPPMPGRKKGAEE